MSYKDKFEQNGYHISLEENVDIKIHEIPALFLYLQEKWMQKAIEVAEEKCHSNAKDLKNGNASAVMIDDLRQCGDEFEVCATYEHSPSCSCCGSS